MKTNSSDAQEIDSRALKRNFVSVASHELRTPLSSILLSVSLIEKYAQRQETELVLKHSEKIKSTVNNLKGILEDFLSLEKLDTGQIKAVMETFDLEELCREMMEEMQEMALSEQELRFVYEGEKTINLDKHLLKNAVVNLIANAVKFAGPRAIIELKVVAGFTGTTIQVNDNGAGIPEHCHKDLFTPFYRVHSSGTIPGTGLGLNIVQRYVRLMNGELHFESVPGQKTSFEMSFPITADEKTAL